MADRITRRQFIRRAAGTALIVSASGGPLMVGCTRREFDLLIRGGLVIDGLGGNPFIADIGIRDGRITAIGQLDGKTAARIVDASGKAVSPGFIDVHTHTDVGLLINPKAESKIRQGVTTEISGQCGDSPFPLAGPSGDRFKERMANEFGLDVDWTDLDGFLTRLERNRTAVNYTTFAGHGSIRAAIMGEDNRAPTSEEMRKMQDAVRTAMEQGAFGLSSGLEYTPGSFAETDEIVALCRVVSKQGGLYATHMRSEDIRVEEALEEAISIAQQADIPLQISHLKASQQRNWHKLPGMLDRIAQAERDGIAVHADRYTYAAWATTLTILFPMWSREGGERALTARLADEAQWRRIKPELLDKVDAMGGWERVLISRITSEVRRHCQGKIVTALAEETGTDPTEMVRKLLIDENGDVGMVGFAMSEENTGRVLAFPLTMVSSDGNAVAPYGPLSRENPHPRYYGTFPRYLGHYVRERKILPLPEAIRRISSLPAKTFGIPDRGEISENMVADVVIFDPDRIIDKATFTAPHQYPEGIDAVIVNGQIVVEKGEHTGALPGRVLRKV